MSKIKTTLKDKIPSIVVGIIMSMCVAVFCVYAVQYVGTRYTQNTIHHQLSLSGLTDLVHYETIKFNPFTLTPSIDNVKIGPKNAPWLKLAKIRFNSITLHYPDLDIDFWIERSTLSDLSKDTNRLMQAIGIDTLLGKGSFTSVVKGKHISSHLLLDVKDIGIINAISDVTTLDHNISVSELRTDLLASLALGQPEAMFIIYGHLLELHSLRLEYKDSGLIAQWFPEQLLTIDYKNALQNKLKNNIQSLGLATASSSDAEKIADTASLFIQNPSQHTLSLLLPFAINAKELALLFSDKNLYEGSNMRISYQ